MQFQRPIIASLSIAATSAIIFVVGGHFAANRLIETQQAMQLRELGDVALRRSEMAVDFGAATLDELAHRGSISCDESVLQAVRLHVYQRGTVKDIRVVSRDGSVLCSAYSETLEFDKGWASRDEMLPARDKALRIFRVDQFFGVALGVLKDIDAKTSLVAILGISESLFDIMPTELRDHSEVLLELGKGQTIIHRASPARLDASSGIISVATVSERYSLRTIIRVDRRALGAWHHEPYVPIVALAALLGLAFGILFGRVISRPESPGVELDKALAAHEFKPYLQPIFGLRTGNIVGCEALARWVRADGSVVPPSRFIKLAEATGRIERITWQILSATLSELGPLLKRDKKFKVSVNIVPHHIMVPGFIDELRQTVKTARVSARQVVLELTEREEFEDLSAAAAIVGKLRDYGFSVAIDDVGVGNSGLSHIQKLGANILKIDKFFVDSICRDATAATIVEMLVRLASELKMGVVAEGIEDREQLVALISCGIEQGQGFVVSPPLPVREFIDFHDHHRLWARDDVNQRAINQRAVNAV